MNPPRPSFLRALCRPCCMAAALLVAVAACKPAPPVGTAQATPPTNRSTPDQPSAEEAKRFVQSLLQPALRLSDFKADAPVRQPNSNAWMVSVKATLTPTEDLLVPATLEQNQAFYGLNNAQDFLSGKKNEMDELKAWRNIYVRSIYARTYGAFDLPALAPPAHLLVKQQEDGKPLPPIYGKLYAEWQVDHWKWNEPDMQPLTVGRPRAMFGSDPTLVLGSPEADAVAAAQRKGMDDLRQKKAAVENRYAKDLAAATKPGTTYKGQVKHPNGTMPCEVRFVETAGAVDPQTVSFEVRLPQAPTYLFSYTAKVSPEVPLDIPLYGAADKPAVPATSDADTDRPVGNLTVHFVRYTGKTSTYGNWPGVMLNGACRISPSDQPFVLLGGHFKGLVGDFNGDFSLDAEQTTP